MNSLSDQQDVAGYGDGDGYGYGYGDGFDWPKLWLSGLAMSGSSFDALIRWSARDAFV